MKGKLYTVRIKDSDSTLLHDLMGKALKTDITIGLTHLVYPFAILQGDILNLYIREGENKKENFINTITEGKELNIQYIGKKKQTF